MHPPAKIIGQVGQTYDGLSGAKIIGQVEQTYNGCQELMDFLGHNRPQATGT